jgi:hypothetical protein
MSLVSVYEKTIGPAAWELKRQAKWGGLGQTGEVLDRMGEMIIASKCFVQRAATVLR